LDSFPSFSHNTILTWTFLCDQIGSSVKIDPKLVISPDGDGKNNVLHIKLDREGCFNAVVKYNDVLVRQGQFTVISLNCELFVSFLSFFLSWQVQHKIMLIRMIKYHWIWPQDFGASFPLMQIHKINWVVKFKVVRDASVRDFFK